VSAEAGSGAPEDGLVRDPHAPDYDPSTLAQFYAAAEIFDAEPRDPQWAPLVEATIGATMLEDLRVLVPAAVEPRFEARTRTCRLTWTGPPAVAETVNAIARELHPAAHHGFGPGALYLFFAGGALRQVHGVDALLAWLNHQRTLGLRGLRDDGRFFARTGIDPSAWAALVSRVPEPAAAPVPASPGQAPPVVPLRPLELSDLDRRLLTDTRAQALHERLQRGVASRLLRAPPCWDSSELAGAAVVRVRVKLRPSPGGLEVIEPVVTVESGATVPDEVLNRLSDRLRPSFLVPAGPMDFQGDAFVRVLIRTAPGS
jgi:hypothetical protein